jgi:hypothetical protein
MILIVILCGLSCHPGDNKISSRSIDSLQIKKRASSYDQGKQLFTRFCNSCHPAPEKNISDQYSFGYLFDSLPHPSEAYLIKYIQDSKQLRSSGDQHSKALHEVWNSNYDHFFKDSLSLQDFTDLILYIKVAAKQRYK